MKRKVAIIDNSTGKTGAIVAILNYTEFVREEFEFIYILPSESQAAKLVSSKGYEVIQLPFLELSKNIRNILFYIPYLAINVWRFNKIVKKHGVELVHSNDFYNLIALIAKAFGAKYKLITHIRFMPDRFPKLLVKFWMKLHLKFAEHIISVSNAVKNKLPTNEKIQVIYDCLIKQNDEAPIKGNQNQEINILSLSHFIEGKGQNFAIESFSKAFSENKNLRMKMVGGDLGLEKNKAYKKNLRLLVKDRGLENIVSFHPEVEDSIKEMQAADIFLNFSESESFSMTTLEALCLGVPVIVSDSGGPAELFEHGQSGILVPNRNVEEMAKSILKLASDSDLRTKFSVNSVQYVNRKFSVTNTYEKLKDIYKQLIKNEN